VVRCIQMRSCMGTQKQKLQIVAIVFEVFPLDEIWLWRAWKSWNLT